MTPKNGNFCLQKEILPLCKLIPPRYTSPGHLLRHHKAGDQGLSSCCALLSFLTWEQIQVGAEPSLNSSWYLKGIILNTAPRLLLYGQRNWSTWMCYPNITELTQLIDSADPRNVEELNHLSSNICLCWLFAFLLKLKWEHLANVSANFSLKSPSSLSFALLFESEIFPTGSGVWNLTLHLVILFWKVEVGQSLRVRSLLEEMNQQG